MIPTTTRRDVLRMADLFCGAGGTSTGAIVAAHKAGLTVDLTAVNHWATAVETHGSNHAQSRHLCADLDSLNPRSLFQEDSLDILWASPECTHHSNARGGRPVRDQSRATAWCVVRWAEALRPRRIFVENVKEFLGWGPLHQVSDPHGELKLGVQWRPDPARKGELFSAWRSALEACGYRVEWRILCAADFGAPTTRRRLFIQAALGCLPIHWPEPTHEKVPKTKTRAWVPARDILDLEDTGESIYERRKPLASATLRRIAVGLERYGLSPHLNRFNGSHKGRSDGANRVESIDDPIGTLDTSNRYGLTTPYLVHLRGTSTAHSLDQPTPTITAGGGHLGLVSPFLISYYGTNNTSPISAPVPTCTTKPRFGLVAPNLVQIGDAIFRVDIRFRMLKPAELARAQGFPDSYRFAGTQADVVRQIGNAVPPQLSEALLRPYL